MSGNPKVFHFICRKGIGGVQTQFETFYRHLDQDQSKNSIIVEPCGRNSFSGFLTLFRQLICLVAECRKSSTVIHVYNGLVSFRYLLLFSLLRPVNLIHHERGNAWNLPINRDWLLRLNVSFARFVLCNSKATTVLLKKRFQIDSSKLVVLYNGVHSTSNSIALKNVDRIPCDKVFRVGYVGRLEPHKGVHVLLEAIALCPSKHLHLTVIGDGSQRDFLEKRAMDLGINATFTGMLDHPLEEMKNFNCVVVPSIREPLGNVVIEAGIIRKAVIASKIDGIPEIIEHEKSGILLTPEAEIPYELTGFKIPIPIAVVNTVSEELLPPRQLSAAKLSEAILSLKNNPEICVRLGENLHASILDKFSIEKYTSQLYDIYRQITHVA